MKFRLTKTTLLAGLASLLLALLFFTNAAEDTSTTQQRQQVSNVTIKKRIYKKNPPKPLTNYQQQSSNTLKQNEDTGDLAAAEIENPSPSPQDTAAIEIDELMPMPVLVAVENDDGTIPENTIVTGSCGIYERVDQDGYAELMLTEDCSISLIRRDGLLKTRTPAERIAYSADDMVELDFTFPVERKGGLGVQIGQNDEGIEIYQVMPNTPAEEFGLEAGDVIVEVDDIPASELDIDEFIDKMTGPEGSTVTFRLKGADEDAPPLTLTRAYLDDWQQ